MARAKMSKCKHPACSCLAMEGSEYCSAQCEAVKNTPDVDCRCNHGGCKGRAH
jgi:hypothetical protein